MKLFSKSYVKKEIVEYNVILLFLYVIATPLSKVFVWFKISPNAITIGSILAAIAAFISLIVHDGYLYFCVFWTISLHLDFCDGTVARMTGNINKTAFRFDHTSDIFKISLVLLGAGIFYNTLVIWILSATALFSFLFTAILNHDIGAYNKMSCFINAPVTPPKSEQNSDSNSLKSRLRKSVVILNLFTFFVTMNGHTLVFFLMIPFGIIHVEIFLIYIILITLFRSVIVINRLVKLPKIKSVN